MGNSLIEREAAKIPAKYRKEILDLNLISKASKRDEGVLQYLSTVYRNYIEPEFELGCPVCINRMVEALVAMQPHLIRQEREHQLLNSIQ